MVWVGFEDGADMERTVVDDDQTKAQLVKVSNWPDCHCCALLLPSISLGYGRRLTMSLDASR